jgi:protein SCO1/2
MNTKVVQVGLGGLVLIGVVIAVTVFFPKVESFRGTLYDPALPAAEIELTQGNGSNFRLSEMRGDVVLLYFGYTFCPDVCPTTLSELNRVIEGMGLDGERVQVVMVTVDPERDTLEKLREYVAIFNPKFIGLSGPLEELEKVWNDYGVYREEEQMPNSATGYLVNHTARVYLIDQDGNLRLSYSYGTPPDDIVHDLKILFE